MTGQHPRKDCWRIRNLKFVTGWLHCVHPFTMSYLQYRCSCQPDQGLLFFLGFRDRACSTAASPPAEVRCRSRIKIRACWESDLAPVSASPGGDAAALVLWFHRTRPSGWSTCSSGSTRRRDGVDHAGADREAGTRRELFERQPPALGGLGGVAAANCAAVPSSRGLGVVGISSTVQG